MNRLWVRLSLAFGLVTLTAVIIAALLANFQVSTDFRRYIMHNQMMESTLLPPLADYYAQNGSWAGVESVLDSVRGPGMGMGRGSGNGQGQRQGAPQLVLADSDYRVVFAENGAANLGSRLARNDLQNALPIQVNNRVAGYLLSTAPGAANSALSESAQAFLEQVNRSLLQAGLIAGILGMVLGVFIARGLAAPLGRLATAARRIARGQLSQRVPEKGADEVADLARAFNEMAQHLEQAEQLRRNLVADVAHELRTPLSVVQGNLRAILDDVYPLDKEEIASIYDETIVLNRLISDLRELAQAEAGQLQLNLSPTELPPLLESTADLFRELAREKDIRVETRLAPALPPVQADADRLRQVLHNFLSNALRHTPAGGKITLAARPQNGGLRVSVTDTGSGIPAADLPHVFDRFWRADKSRTREQGGSGLGLAIARQIIQTHGGQVGADSTPGAGSEFWFTLPLSPDLASTPFDV
ncbi:MAG: HAMP domain-containing protein [Chloroflexi bacterium]|nr:MAG: HAMP domain-containing protein [Chloroflexota bacterium]